MEDTEDRTDPEREAGARVAERDHALARLDETEIKARLVQAFDRFLKLGFAVHLVGVQVRGAIEYRIALYPDGTDTVPSDKLQAVADEFRLEYTIEKDSSYEGGWAVVFYPRW